MENLQKHIATRSTLQASEMNHDTSPSPSACKSPSDASPLALPDPPDERLYEFEGAYSLSSLLSLLLHLSYGGGGDYGRRTMMDARAHMCTRVWRDSESAPILVYVCCHRNTNTSVQLQRIRLRRPTLTQDLRRTFVSGFVDFRRNDKPFHFSVRLHDSTRGGACCSHLLYEMYFSFT